MTPEFGQPQTTVAILFAALALGLAGVFTLVALRSRSAVEMEGVQRVGYAIRRRWLVFLVSLGVIALGISFFFLPYSAGARPDVVVKASGGQFYWSTSPASVPAGSRVRFEVTSVDVNHGFGIYDPDGQLLGSVQAMPGYTNNLDIDLDEPGEYLISCLEFCGVKHHEMARTIEVTR